MQVLLLISLLISIKTISMIKQIQKNPMVILFYKIQHVYMSILQTNSLEKMNEIEGQFKIVNAMMKEIGAR